MNLRYRAFLVLFVLLAFPFLYSAVGFDKPLALALASSVIALWISELLPLALTALLVPCLAVLYGILSPVDAFLPFGDQILYLIAAVFLLVVAFRKSGLDQRIALSLLSLPYVSRSAEHLVLSLTLLCWVMGMWMSNTATCALMLPLALSIIKLSSRHQNAAFRRNLSTRLLLLCAFTPSIGGMATPIGSLPNMVAIRAFNERGVSVSFLDWCLYALPVATTLLAVSCILLRVLFPLRGGDLREAARSFQTMLQARGPMRRAEYAVLICFLAEILLWIVPGVASRLYPDNAWISTLQQQLTPGIVAILCIFPLFLIEGPEDKSTSLLTAADFSSIDWNAILLFGGGLTLGHVLTVSGLAQDLASHLPNPADGVLIAAIGIALTALLLSEFCSNTASAAILVPIVLALAPLESPLGATMAALTVFACGLGYALPVSTPPNAMVYGTGHLKLRDMCTSGIALDILAVTIIITLVVYLLPSAQLFPSP